MIGIKNVCAPLPNEKLATPDTIAEYFRKQHEQDLDNGLINPFCEPRKRGKKSLETLMRLDFKELWDEDLAPPRRNIGFVGAFLNPKDFKNPFPSSKAGKLKFIQRGHE